MPITPIQSLSVCKSHLFPFTFVSTTVFFLCINACSHTQSGPNHRHQARKKGKEGARKEAKGPKVKVSFRRVRSFLLYSPLTRSTRSSSMHQSTVFVIYFLHSHNPYSEAFMRKKPKGACSPYFHHGCVGNESSTQFGSHFARMLSLDSSPTHSHSTSGECPHHSSLCMFLWYALFLCVSTPQISG